MMVASLVVYAIAQVFDVWMYHTWRRLSTRLCDEAANRSGCFHRSLAGEPPALHLSRRLKKCSKVGVLLNCA